MPSGKQQEEVHGRVKLFDTPAISIWHPQAFLGPGGIFEPWALPTKSAAYPGVKRYCPHFDFLADIAAHCGVDKPELAATDLYCGHFAKEEYTALKNLAGRQGTEYRQSCFCVRLYTALCACHQASQALMRREVETHTQLLPEWIFGESDPLAIITHKKQIQGLMVHADIIYEALIIARVVTSGIDNYVELAEEAGVLISRWTEDIRDLIIGLPRIAIHHVGVAPELCPEAPPYRSFEGIMS